MYIMRGQGILFSSNAIFLSLKIGFVLANSADPFRSISFGSCYIWCVFVMLSCASVYCCPVATCLERADLLALVFNVLL